MGYGGRQVVPRVSLQARGQLSFRVIAAAETSTENPAPTTAASTQTNSATRRITLAQLSGQSNLTLRGTDGSATVTLGVRADELIVGATLQLRYSHSPALIKAQSHL